MENQARNERREQMLRKVRKLLAFGNDDRGNATERETALRQANKLMAEHGIEEAECDMAAIQAGELTFGEAMAMANGRAPEPGKVSRQMPTWAGVLSLGCAKFCDCNSVQRMTVQGKVLVFQGEKQDVLLARWIFGALVHSIDAELRASGWKTSGAEATQFRYGAAGALQRRMYELAAERRRMYQEAQQASNSRALMVVDTKANQLVANFGKQKIQSAHGTISGATIAGRTAGQRINIPSGRPLNGSTNKQLN